MRMRTIAIIAAAVAGASAPANATDFVQDGAAMFSRAAVAQVEGRIESEYRRTGRVVHVRTASGTGIDGLAAARDDYRRLHVNGIEIYVSPDMHEDREVMSKSVPKEVGNAIHEAIAKDMRANEPDKALMDATNVAIEGLDHGAPSKEAAGPSHVEQAAQPAVAPEEHRGSPWGWVLVILSLGGLGGALYAWRRKQEAELLRPAKPSAIARVQGLLETNDEAKKGTSNGPTVAPASQMAKDGPSATPPSPPPTYAPVQSSGPAYYPGPVVVHDGGGDMLTGMMVGEMMAGERRDTEVIHETTVVHDPAPNPEPTSSSGGGWSSSADDEKTSGGSWSSGSDQGTSGGGWGGGSSSSDESSSGGGWGSSSSDSSSGGGWGGGDSSSSDFGGGGSDSGGGW